MEPLVSIRPAIESDQTTLYQLMTTDEEWMRFNGPYFPYTHPTREDYESGIFSRLVLGESAQVVVYQGRPVGVVTFYWEDESTRWLEVGIVLYDSSVWNKGIATQALTQWTSLLFALLKIERVGLTTWSGNPGMMAAAEKIGMQQEGRLRKVRYHQGEYFDSVKYGVLREEWLRKHR